MFQVQDCFFIQNEVLISCNPQTLYQLYKVFLLIVQWIQHLQYCNFLDLEFEYDVQKLVVNFWGRQVHKIQFTNFDWVLQLQSFQNKFEVQENDQPYQRLIIYSCEVQFNFNKQKILQLSLVLREYL
ncbi:unnamed protein product [Paramecium pentaurelia]|uniref:Uncharacterized protein n=1 Tax=Paramecium pentaurelia TaxID=43138 RepID=A0A8S1UDI0_9CILI|nr:unnamed protein product [Paramecium pentaurelia]